MYWTCLRYNTRQQPIELLVQAPFTALLNEQSSKTGARTYITPWNQELFFGGSVYACKFLNCVQLNLTYSY